MSGKGGIACTQPAHRRPVRPLFAHRQRPDRGLGLPDRRRLQARRDRDQALRAAAAAHPGHPSRHRRRGDRPLHPGRDRAVGRCARRARRPCRGAVRQRRGRPRARAPTMSPRSRRAWQAWEDDAAPRLNSRDRPVHMARLCRELNDAAGRTRSWSPTAGSPRIGPGCSTTPSGRDGISSPTAASPRSATGCRAASARRSRRRTRRSSRSPATAGST